MIVVSQDGKITLPYERMMFVIENSLSFGNKNRFQLMAYSLEASYESDSGVGMAAFKTEEYAEATLANILLAYANEARVFYLSEYREDV